MSTQGFKKNKDKKKELNVLFCSLYVSLKISGKLSLKTKELRMVILKYDMIQYETICYDALQYDMIQYNVIMIRYDTIRCEYDMV